MTSPLQIKSFQFHLKIHCFLYSHVITMNTRIQQFEYEKSLQKLLPFYFGLFNNFFNISGSFYTILKYICTQNNMPLYYIVLQITFCFAQLFAFLLNCLFLSENDLIICINKLFKLATTCNENCVSVTQKWKWLLYSGKISFIINNILDTRNLTIFFLNLQNLGNY